MSNTQATTGFTLRRLLDRTIGDESKEDEDTGFFSKAFNDEELHMDVNPEEFNNN
jgi:hypothetical protein